MATTYGMGLLVGDKSSLIFQDLQMIGNSSSSALGGSYSGGMGLMIGSLSEVTGSRLLIADNVTRSDYQCLGMGMLVSGTSVVDLSNVVIAGNVDEGCQGFGGAIAVSGDSTLTLTQATLAGNSASYYGGALYLKDGSPTVTLKNVAITGNEARTGGAIDDDSTDTLILNISYSDIYDNGDSPFSDVSDPTGADGNFSADPLYMDLSSSSSADWDIHPSDGSPLIDAGDPSILDLDGSPSDVGATGGPDASVE